MPAITRRLYLAEVLVSRQLFNIFPNRKWSSVFTEVQSPAVGRQQQQQQPRDNNNNNNTACTAAAATPAAPAPARCREEEYADTNVNFAPKINRHWNLGRGCTQTTHHPPPPPLPENEIFFTIEGNIFVALEIFKWVSNIYGSRCRKWRRDVLVLNLNLT